MGTMTDYFINLRALLMNEEKKIKDHFNEKYKNSPWKNMYEWMEGVLFEYYDYGVNYGKNAIERAEDEEKQKG